MIEVRKVYAYIVQTGELVVFEEPAYPEAGIQVPGGSIEPGETPQVAVLREAYEETGLKRLEIAHYLGYQRRDLRDYDKDEIHLRHFYALTCANTIPPRWEHVERYRSDGSVDPITFALYRVDLASVPPLIAEMGLYLPKLRHIFGVACADGAT